jgi:hypothetical protein
MEKLWAERVAHLKEWLRENPSEQTPELRFLTERDWLNSIYPHTLETSEDCRRAMSLVRANASNKVMDQFFKAGRLYAGDNNGQSATDLSQLAPYLESPIDSAILQRYEIVAATNLVPELQKFGDWVVTQKSPINEALDSRSAYGLNAAGVADSRVTNRWNVSH